MRTLIAVLIGALALTRPCAHAFAQTVSSPAPPECRVVENLVETHFPLDGVRKAIANKRLDVMVIGAGSSSLPGEGQSKAYPSRLQLALKEKLPDVEVNVATDVKAGRTAAEMVQTIKKTIGTAKPALMIWQTGTVDAVRSIEPDNFAASLEKGITNARAAGADTILMNMQYSPRTESMIALGNYLENMRWVALQHEIPLFDRFSIMKVWAELGTFDFYSPTKKLDAAERVHDCIGRLLADLIIEAAKSDGPPSPPEIR